MKLLNIFWAYFSKICIVHLVFFLTILKKIFDSNFFKSDCDALDILVNLMAMLLIAIVIKIVNKNEEVVLKSIALLLQFIIFLMYFKVIFC
jgi:hypothetical protein